MVRKLLLSVAIAGILTGCGGDSASTGTPTAATAETPAAQAASAGEPVANAAIGTWGFDTDAMDAATKPGDDFNRFANGQWLDKFEVPADLSSFGLFTKLRLDAEDDIRTIVEELASREPTAGSLEQKVGDYFEGWMNTERLDELGAAPLRPHLDRIAGIETLDDVNAAFADLHMTAPFGIGIIPDPADTTRYIAFVSQAGLGMPNRDYYLKEEDRFAQYRTAYQAYIATLFTAAGIDDGAAKAEAILALETRIAEVHWTPQESRDIQKIYNPMPPAALAELAPEFAWSSILDELGLGGVDTFVVAQTTAIDAAGEIFAETSVDLWRDYLAFHLISDNARYLSSAFDEASYEFYSKTLRGTEEQRERWKRGVQEVNAGLGEAVGQIYVEQHFPSGYKAQMEDLVGNLVAAFEERLQQNEWMDDATREQALLKLSTFEPRIGFTDQWTDFSDLDIEKGAMLDNALAVSEFQWKQQVDRLGGPVDRAQWPYPPQTVNASYNPLLNQITFPAGILQPPFFDPNADAAVNYGAIGAVIGHEIGHGFDDQGRRFDQKGRIRDWWTQTSNDRFAERSGALGKQYGAFSPIEGMSVNPQLTMGENIGDLGGVQMAHAAYRRHLDQCCNGEAPVIDGMTGDQRFFLGWAQVWRAKEREDSLRQRLLTDPHSPAQYRINGVVRNLDEWYAAFDVSEDDAMYLPPEARVRIW
ncbi:MAG: M13 family metallopeptidase [Pseudomonadota bacterium]